MPELDRPDHGNFFIHLPREDRVILELYDLASRNPDRPGEASSQVETVWSAGASVERGLKQFYLDTNAQVLCITESWGGVETARRTLDLADEVN